MKSLRLDSFRHYEDIVIDACGSAKSTGLVQVKTRSSENDRGFQELLNPTEGKLRATVWSETSGDGSEMLHLACPTQETHQHQDRHEEQVRNSVCK